MVIGAVTATGFGTFVFQALGTVLLGVLGALGGYIFTRFIKPRIDKALKIKK